MAPPQKKSGGGEDEFLWLVSLSDLMILLFIFFVVLFSFTFKKLKQADLNKIAATFRTGAKQINPVDEIQRNLDQWVAKIRLGDMVTVRRTDDEIVVEIRDKLLFGSGEYRFHEDGIKIIQLLAKIIEKIPKPYQIGIEGHTDDSPIHTNTIEDNWDLSAKRSLAVLRAMDLSLPVLMRTVSMAYGEMKPIVPNRDAMGRSHSENQSKNRRVTVRIF